MKILVTADVSQAIQGTKQLKDQFDVSKLSIEQASKQLAALKTTLDKLPPAIKAMNVDHLTAEMTALEGRIKELNASALAPLATNAGQVAPKLDNVAKSTENLGVSVGKQKIVFTDFARSIDGQGLSLRNLTSSLGLLGPEFFAVGAAVSLAGLAFAKQLKELYENITGVTALKDSEAQLADQLGQTEQGIKNQTTSFELAKTAIDAFLHSVDATPSSIAKANAALAGDNLSQATQGLNNLKKNAADLNAQLAQLAINKNVSALTRSGATQFNGTELIADATKRAKEEAKAFTDALDKAVASNENTESYKQTQFYKEYIGSDETKQKVIADYIKAQRDLNEQSKKIQSDSLTQNTALTEAQQLANKEAFEQQVRNLKTSLQEQLDAEKEVAAQRRAAAVGGPNEAIVERGINQSSTNRELQIRIDNQRQVIALEKQYYSQLTAVDKEGGAQLAIQIQSDLASLSHLISESSTERLKQATDNHKQLLAEEEAYQTQANAQLQSALDAYRQKEEKFIEQTEVIEENGRQKELKELHEHYIQLQAEAILYGKSIQAITEAYLKGVHAINDKYNETDARKLAKYQEAALKARGQAAGRSGSLTGPIDEERYNLQDLNRQEKADKEQAAKEITNQRDLQEAITAITEKYANARLAVEEEALNKFRDKVSGLRNLLDSAFENILNGKNPFDNIGRSLDQMLKKMIAVAAETLILKELFKAFGGISGDSSGGAGVGGGSGTGAIVGSILGKVLSSVFAFADGGLVTKPTLGLVGEAGPEMIVPLSKIDKVFQSIPQATGNVNVTVRGKLSGNDMYLLNERTKSYINPVS